jgi:hypothetical protein
MKPVIPAIVTRKIIPSKVVIALPPVFVLKR